MRPQYPVYFMHRITVWPMTLPRSKEERDRLMRTTLPIDALKWDEKRHRSWNLRGWFGSMALILLFTLTPRTAYTECTTIKPLLFSSPCDFSGSYVADFQTFSPREEMLRNTLDLTLIDEVTPDESTVIASYDGVLSLQGHMFNFRSPNWGS